MRWVARCSCEPVFSRWSPFFAQELALEHLALELALEHVALELAQELFWSCSGACAGAVAGGCAGPKKTVYTVFKPAKLQRNLQRKRLFSPAKAPAQAPEKPLRKLQSKKLLRKL